MSERATAGGGGSSGFVYITAGVAAIGGSLFRYDTGIISNAVIYYVPTILEDAGSSVGGA